MMDLAYSSLLLNSRELAEEVKRLEKQVNLLHRNFQLRVLSSRVLEEEAEDFLGLLKIGEVTERIADTAGITEVTIRNRYQTLKEALKVDI